MTVSGIESTGTPASLATSLVSTGPTAGFGGATDKDTFLQLLVAQLKYQDPLNPTDNSQFLAQTAQFNALEQMTAVAEQTAAMVGYQAAFGATSMIGKDITYADETGASVSGLVSGVRFDPTGPILTVDGVDVPMNNVLSISAPTPTTATEQDSAAA